MDEIRCWSGEGEARVRQGSSECVHLHPGGGEVGGGGGGRGGGGSEVRVPHARPLAVLLQEGLLVRRRLTVGPEEGVRGCAEDPQFLRLRNLL